MRRLVCAMTVATTTPTRRGETPRIYGPALVVFGLFVSMTRLLPKDMSSPPTWALALALAYVLVAGLMVLAYGKLAFDRWLTSLGPYAGPAVSVASVIGIVALGPASSWLAARVLDERQGLLYLVLWSAAAVPILAQLLLHRDRWPAEWNAQARMLVLVGGALHVFVAVWLTALWRAALADQSSIDAPLHVLFVVSIVVLSGLMAILQVWESTEVLSAPIASIDDLAPNEALWLNARRSAAGLAGGTGRDLPPATIGLALSGGGIRAATVSLGFLHGLALRTDAAGKRLLGYVDYMSTVSGSGWLGGALTARLSEPLGETPNATVFELDRGEDWRCLIANLRKRGDYVIPGGPGFSAGTLRPLVAIAWGAVINALTFCTLAFAVVALLANSAEQRGVLWRALKAFSLLPVIGSLFVDSGRLANTLYTVNLVALLFAAAVSTLVAGFVAMLVGYLLSGRLAHGFGASVASQAALATAATGLALLALHGSVALTLLVGFGALLGLLALFARRLSKAQWAGVAGAIFAGEGVLANVPGLRDALKDITGLWSRGLTAVLLLPGALTKVIAAELGAQESSYLFVVGTVGFAFIALSLYVSRNRTSLHGFWTRQIKHAYLAGLRDEPGDWPLAKFRPEGPEASPNVAASANTRGPAAKAPLHIINAAVNTPGSQSGTHKQRGTSRFEFSPYFFGGPATGWAPAERFGWELSLGGALAVSAAAVNSQGGHTIPRAARALLSFLNLDLGVWLRNPKMARDGDLRFRRYPHFWSSYARKELLGSNSENDTLIFVSDGGHHENLGLTALVERDCELVICLDAGADPEWTCADLARAARLLRIDGEWELSGLDLDQVRPKKKGQGSVKDRTPASPVAIGTFTREVGGRRTLATLVYVKVGLTKDLPFDVREYAEANPTFPQQTTADQFFDEAQFEAYRIVGERLAECVAEAIEKSSEARAILAKARGTDPAPGDVVAA